MEFEENDWHSDNHTDILVKTLFGTLSSAEIIKNEAVSKGNHIQETKADKCYKQQSTFYDADAVICKKQRKRMKEKRRKKNKKNMNEEFSEDESNSSEDEMTVTENMNERSLSNTSLEKPKIKNKNKKRRSKKSLSENTTNVISDSQEQDNGVSRIFIVAEDQKNCMPSTDNSKENDLSKDMKKEKFISNDVKKVSTEISHMPKKRKRPCKKNKYKHLGRVEKEKSSDIADNEKTNILENKSIAEILVKDVDKVTSPEKNVNKIANETKEKASRLLKQNVKGAKKRKIEENVSELDKKSKIKCKRDVSNISVDKEISQSTSEHTEIMKSGGKRKYKNIMNAKEINTEDAFNQSRNRLNENQHLESCEKPSSSSTTRKNKLSFDVDKLRTYLDIRKMQQNKDKMKLKQKKENSMKKTDKVHLKDSKHQTRDKNNSTNLETFKKSGDTKEVKKVVSITTNQQTSPKSGEVKQTQKNMSLRERMLDRLSSARFRYLSEQMYTQTGSEALALFSKDKEAFRAYHEGYQAQVSKWPLSPLNVIIKDIQNQSPDLVIADFGCGEAVLAQSVPNKVHSFDLVSLNKHVTACDMAKVPLANNSVDLAVFCLSLMGTNLSDYLCEANRVLKKGGLLKIAEVASRFERKSRFVRDVEMMGFQFSDKNTENKMFYLFDFVKTGNVKKAQLPDIQLNPCLYKRR